MRLPLLPVMIGAVVGMLAFVEIAKVEAIRDAQVVVFVIGLVSHCGLELISNNIRIRGVVQSIKEPRSRN